MFNDLFHKCASVIVPSNLLYVRHGLFSHPKYRIVSLMFSFKVFEAASWTISPFKTSCIKFSDTARQRCCQLSGLGFGFEMRKNKLQHCALLIPFLLQNHKNEYMYQFHSYTS